VHPNIERSRLDEADAAIEHVGYELLFAPRHTNTEAAMIDLSAIREATPAEMPVIDLSRFDEESKADLHRFGDEIVGALRTSGFFVLLGHGMRRAVIRGGFEAAREFHALAPERKCELAMGQGFVGYLASGDYTVKTSEVNANTKADINAAFFFDRERMADDPEVVARVPFRYTNKWPHELPLFREKCLRYFYAMEALGRALLPAIAAGLGTSSDYFDEAFQSPQGTVRMSHYPVARYETNQFGIAPHTDSNFITLLPQSDVEGLYIMNAREEWVRAPKIRGAITVNSGEMLKRWSNDTLKSTRHFAANLSGESRYAIPYFMAPNTRYLMEAIPSCVPPGEKPKHPPLRYEEYRLWFMRSNYQSRVGQASA
jgi:isopenicillin N synthase-like dioxygenase